MKSLRAILIWTLALSLPIEGMASVAMTHCKDMQATESMHSMPAGHDHAAMMAMVSTSGSESDSDSMAQGHHAQPSSDAKPVRDIETSKAGCQCGCKCNGDCAVSCAGMMISLPQVGFSLVGADTSVSTAMPHGQAHAAYRYDPLRPPSAVAL